MVPLFVVARTWVGDLLRRVETLLDFRDSLLLLLSNRFHHGIGADLPLLRTDFFLSASAVSPVSVLPDESADALAWRFEFCAVRERFCLRPFGEDLLLEDVGEGGSSSCESTFSDSRIGGNSA